MYYIGNIPCIESDVKHFGIPGMKWGQRRYQNEDGTLTEEGKRRYGYYNDNGPVSEKESKRSLKKLDKYIAKNQFERDRLTYQQGWMMKKAHTLNGKYAAKGGANDKEKKYIKKLADEGLAREDKIESLNKQIYEARKEEGKHFANLINKGIGVRKIVKTKAYYSGGMIAAGILGGPIGISAYTVANMSKPGTDYINRSTYKYDKSKKLTIDLRKMSPYANYLATAGDRMAFDVIQDQMKKSGKR